MNLTLSYTTLDKYFELLKNFDNKSKELLIQKLNNSIKKNKKNEDISSFYGSWEDNKSSDEIINELYSDRKDKNNLESF